MQGKTRQRIFTSFILVRQSSTAIGDAIDIRQQHLFHSSNVLLLLETFLNRKKEIESHTFRFFLWFLRFVIILYFHKFSVYGVSVCSVTVIKR